MLQGDDEDSEGELDENNMAQLMNQLGGGQGMDIEGQADDDDDNSYEDVDDDGNILPPDLQGIFFEIFGKVNRCECG